MNDTELMKIIREAIAEATKGDKAASKCTCVCDGEVEDISAYSLRDEFNIPNPYNKEEYMRLKAKTDARLGVWRCGPRPLTKTTLRLRADNAAAMDAVFNDVAQECLDRNNLKAYQTKCDSKETYLTRPDLGRQRYGSLPEYRDSRRKRNMRTARRRLQDRVFLPRELR